MYELNKTNPKVCKVLKQRQEGVQILYLVNKNYFTIHKTQLTEKIKY